ncbi:MAG: hypothetical protein JO093_18705 [Acidobacteria bacterium]|nr:hypothetical protein [Acidobacteriota bacterium]MBV9187654.1 hypothetical protein [Acidobacteriota bacterium]
MLNPDEAANVRAIFVHDGGAVTVDEAAALLGWPLATMDAAIKWRAVTIDAGTDREPRISRGQLLEHAFDQWPLNDIKAALTGPQWRALRKRCGASFGRLAVCDRDTLRDAAAQPSRGSVASAALVRPELAAKLARAEKRKSKANVVVPEQFKRHRRDRDVRMFTLTRFEVRYRDFVPMLRIRGRWLARLGFKPDMCVYVVAQPGALLITTTHPAKLQQGQPDEQQPSVSSALRLALAAPQHQVARRSRAHGVAEG